LPLPELGIYIDETCPWRIADELKRRGRLATSHKHLRTTGTKDPDLFPVLAGHADRLVLVTYDNAMPLAHGPDLTEHGITLAIIDKKAVPPELTTEQYWREVIHRHAHRFASQDPGSWWKYRCSGRARLN
jgi:hypothetical protein